MVSNGNKKCPYCAELIKEEAIKWHCGSDLTHNPDSTVSQKTDDEYLEEARRKAGLQQNRFGGFFLPGEREWRHYAN